MKKIISILILMISTGVLASETNHELTATIIGSGSPIYNEHRSGPSVLISGGDTTILVDMGNGTQANLSKLEIDSREFSALLFTHHHLDHNEEFVPLFIRSLMGRKDFLVVGPPNTVQMVETNLKLYEEDIQYRLEKTNRSLNSRMDAFEAKDIQGGESFSIGSIKVTTLKVPHTIHTIAYRFEYNETSIVVTGDLIYTETLAGLAKNADFMIIDSGGIVMKRKGSKNDGENSQNKTNSNRGKKRSSKERAHVTLDESSLMAKEANIKNLVYTHFNKGNIDEEASLEKIRENYQGNVIFGEDLMKLKVTNQ